MQERMKKLAVSLLESGKCDRILGWKVGEFFYDLIPATFSSAEEIEKEFVFNSFAGANLSKYLIAESRKGGCVGVFLKPCDTFSCQQLIKEHRIKRENIYIIGVACDGMVSVDAIRGQGCKGILGVSEKDGTLTVHTAYGDREIDRRKVLYEHCRVCKSKELVICDEQIGEQSQDAPDDRFAQVAALEAMTPEERFAFWRGELSRCIRCNACRNVCPACSCEKCVFDNPDSGVQNKAASDSFEENMFHIIRAFHVAGRCTDCGQCSRVCPQHIPLHLLNRKFIKDINDFYGTYQAGADLDTRPPLTNFTTDDPEPSVVQTRGGKL